MTNLQKRGTITVPQADRHQLGWTDGQLLLTTVTAPGQLCLRAIPDAETLWAQYGDAFVPLPETAVVPPPRGLWIPPDALWAAQADPQHPWRAVWQAISQGQRTMRWDPALWTVIAEQLPERFPSLSRSDWAWYGQVVCAWPGVEMADRSLWLRVWEVWGQQDISWSTAVWQVRNAETEEE